MTPFLPAQAYDYPTFNADLVWGNTPKPYPLWSTVSLYHPPFQPVFAPHAPNTSLYPASYSSGYSSSYYPSKPPSVPTIQHSILTPDIALAQAINTDESSTPISDNTRQDFQKAHRLFAYSVLLGTFGAEISKSSLDRLDDFIAQKPTHAIAQWVQRNPKWTKALKFSVLGKLALSSLIPWTLGDRHYRKGLDKLNKPAEDWRHIARQEITAGSLLLTPTLAVLLNKNWVKHNKVVSILVSALSNLGGILIWNGVLSNRKAKGRQVSN